MKTILIIAGSVLLLSACSHNPPKPYGQAFPINQTAGAAYVR